MLSSLRSFLVVLAAVAAIVPAHAAGKGRPPAPPKPHLPKLPPPPKLPPVRFPPAVRPIYKAPRPISPTKVNVYRRPAVHHYPVQRVRFSGPRMVRQPVRRAAFRTVHRYPVRRLPRRFVHRPYYYYRGYGRYSYSYYPRRHVWRTGIYGGGYGIARRRTARLIGGIVESVQGNPLGGTLVVRAPRSRSSRFRYAPINVAAGRRATSLHRFQLTAGTLYEVMTMPPRGGTIADLHRGERVLVLTQANSGRTAQVVKVASRRRR